MINSMDIVYHALLTVFGGKAFFAPLKNPQRIADMGTGTGKSNDVELQNNQLMMK